MIRVILALFALASAMLAQSEFAATGLRLIPRDATTTGCLRVFELRTNGVEKVDVCAPDAIDGNKSLRFPNENGILVGTQNRVFGSDIFQIKASKATGTLASPGDVGLGATAFSFLGEVRSGGSYLNGGSLNFTVIDDSPLSLSANIGLQNAGSFGDVYSFEPLRFIPLNTRPDLGSTTVANRWGTLYGSAADFLVPSSPNPFETGSFVRTQTLGIYDIGGQNGGWALTAENETVGDSFLRITDSTAADALRIYRKIGNVATNHVRSYMDIFPDQANTYRLGSDVLLWDEGWITDVNATNLSLKGNSTWRTYIQAGSSMSDNVSLTLPSANGLGPMCNNGSGLLSWGTCGGGGGSAPLSDVKITDYGAATDCSAPITGVSGPWEDAYAAVQALGGGIIAFPPGCYAIAATLQVGNGTSSAESTQFPVTLVGAGGVLLPGTVAGTGDDRMAATEIRWTGSAPGSVTPMVKFQGPIAGGGIRDLALNANSVANVAFVHQIHQVYGKFEKLFARRSRTSPSWLVTTLSPNYPWGACYNRYDSIFIGDFDAGSGAGGWHFTGADAGNAVDSCSNYSTNIETWFDGDTIGTYGLKLEGADNNRFAAVNYPSVETKFIVIADPATDRLTLASPNNNFANGEKVKITWLEGGSAPTGLQHISPYWVVNKLTSPVHSFQVSLTKGGAPVDFTTTGTSVAVFLHNPSVVLKYWSPALQYPQQNVFHGIAVNNEIRYDDSSGAYIGSGNSLWELNECFTFPCIYPGTPVQGSWDGILISGRGSDPMGVLHFGTDADDTFQLNNFTGNSGGSIVFKSIGDPIGRLNYDAIFGMRFYSKGLNPGDTLTARWRISPTGDLLPMSAGAYLIGGQNDIPKQVWSQAFRTYTSASYVGSLTGVQDNFFTSDGNTNIYCDVYSSAASGDRCALHFRRSGGNLAGPSGVGNGWRMGAIFSWGYPFTVPATGIEFYTPSSGVSGSITPGEIRFSTQDLAGSRQTRWTIDPAGDILPAFSNTRSIGSASLLVANGYFQNITINGTCTGSGCGGGGSYVTTNSDQTVTANKTWTGVHKFSFIQVPDSGSPSVTRFNLYDDQLGTYTSAGVQTGLWDFQTGLINGLNIRSEGAYFKGSTPGIDSGPYLCGTFGQVYKIQTLEVKGGIITTLTGFCGTP